MNLDAWNSVMFQDGLRVYFFLCLRIAFDRMEWLKISVNSGNDFTIFCDGFMHVLLREEK